MSYSQNGEDIFVLNWFGSDFKGTLLEIGANDGITLSNSRLLIENGWSAELVEPGSIFEDLTYLYPIPEYDRVELYKLAIGDRNDTVQLFESGAHVQGGKDRGLVSTVDKSELNRWPDVDFQPSSTQMVTWAKYLKTFSVNKRFDFISIDAEGMDWQILKQMDLTNLGCRCLCIEWNSQQELFKLFVDYCYNFNLKLAVKNAENLIFTI